MKIKQLKNIIKPILKFVLCWGIIILFLKITSSEDPEVNIVSRVIGFCAATYICVKIFYREEFENEKRTPS
jgi:hypothetical protein